MNKFNVLWPLIVALVGIIAAVIDAALGQGFISSAAVGFAVSGSLYWMGITAVGLLIARWPMELLLRIKRDVPPEAAAYVPTDLKVMWSFPVWVIALTAIIVAVFSLDLEQLDPVRYACIIVLQGFFGAVLLTILRRLRFARSGIVLLNWDSSRSARHAKELRAVGCALLTFWIVAPFVFGSNQGALIDAGYRVVQLRKDHATVHVAAPWDRPLTSAGLQKLESFLGPTYARFEDVNVHMRSTDSRVALEVPSTADGSRLINVPRKFVEIE